MPMIFTRPPRRAKPKKLTKAQQALADQWERVKAQHAKPLEQGAKGRGRLPGPGTKLVAAKAQAKPRPRLDAGPLVPSLPMAGVATVPTCDLLAPEKQALKSRLGQSYNKGTVQYLTDDELAEQRSGSHRRR